MRSVRVPQDTHHSRWAKHGKDAHQKEREGKDLQTKSPEEYPRAFFFFNFSEGTTERRRRFSFCILPNRVGLSISPQAEEYLKPGAEEK